MKIGRGTGPLPGPNKSKNVRKVTAAGGREGATKDKKKGSGQGQTSAQIKKQESILGTDPNENATTIDSERPDMSILSAPFPTIEKFIEGSVSLGDVKSLSFTLNQLEKNLPAVKFDAILVQIGEEVRETHEKTGKTFSVLTQKLNEYQNLLNQNKLF